MSELKPEETVARCAIYPKYLDQSGSVFAEEALLSPSKLDPKSKRSPYAISVASRTMLASEAEVHAYGCRTAATSNKNKARIFADKQREFRRPGDSAHYRGFYDVNVKDILKAANSQYNIKVLLHPEEGEEAHCNVVLDPDPNLTSTELKEGRLSIIVIIAASLRGPKTHLCKVDTDLADQLKQSVLPLLPVPKTGSD